MSLAEDLDRLAKLHAEGTLSAEEFARAKARLLAAPTALPFPLRSLRRQSSRTLFGLPLWAIAFGPDWERGELRGHARGVFALGDVATGWVACGGLARGLFAVGGLAVGVVALGGLSCGLLLAVGGAALGSVALGGAAIGGFAVGGAAYGYYAVGGAAGGAHTLSALHQDPAVLDFCRQHLPRLARLLGGRR